MESLDKICSPIINEIKTHRAIRETYNKDIAFDFNPINLFKIDENQISSIIAFFLNPEENHAQGDVFLRIFINKWSLFPEGITQKSHLSKANVTCEFCIPNRRRIDIFIKLGDKCIIIENKLWALDQNEQLNDYIDYAESENLEWRCVYITLDGKAPSTESLGEEKKASYLDKDNRRLWCISHTLDMLELFNDFASVCKADNVRAFVKAVIKYYEYKFKMNLSAHEENIIKKELRKNVDLFKIADQIALAKTNLKQEIRNRILESCLKSFLGNSLGEKYFINWDDRKKGCRGIEFTENELLFYLPNKAQAFHAHLEYGSGNKLYCGIVGDATVVEELKNEYAAEWGSIKNEMKREHKVWGDEYTGEWPIVIDLDDNMLSDNYYLPFLNGEKSPEDQGNKLGSKIKAIFHDFRKKWDSVFISSH
ncbi:PD-(D/E)XK nuclease family protein [Akkermansia sp.]|uniref:PDDEXK-like family protein n=1 Tax=Akkermansia sp. TaxID=1872421 RepID=UPI003AB3AEFB